MTDFAALNRQRTREEQESEPHREIDTLLGLTKHRHRDSWPVPHVLQVKQLSHVLRLLLQESYVAKDADVAVRYLFTCVCHVCNSKIELRGAMRALVFIAVLHRRHSTFVTWRVWHGLPPALAAQRRKAMGSTVDAREV